MSISASINIQVTSHEPAPPTAIGLIQALLSAGWTLQDHDKVSYLPLDDNDRFDWTRENISPEALIKILEKKEAAKELIGVIITWQNTNIGGELLLWGKGKMSLNLSINRKILSETPLFTITDINWYLAKLLPPLNHKILRVGSVFYEEHV